MRQKDGRFRDSLLSRLAADLPGRQRPDAKKIFLEEVGMLLNARFPAGAIAGSYQYASESILAYGLPDTSDQSLVSRQAKDAMAIAIQNTLRIFEPRLTSIRVSVRQPESGMASSVFSIEAMLRLSTDDEPIMIELTKETSSSRFAVRNAT